MNDLQRYANILDDINPWSGNVPAGFTVDFLGTLTSKKFLVWGYHPAYADGAHLDMRRPTLDTGEAGADFWFEVANWVLAVREARDNFVVMTLGALHGYQAVGCCQALRMLNPMPYKLVFVEPIPENVEWVRQNMRDNGIEPDDQWVLQGVMSGSNDPVLFPVGSPGLGAQNCFSTNAQHARAQYHADIVASGRSEETLRNLILHNTTGIQMDIIAGTGSFGEIKYVSAFTLNDVLGPFERVDLIESDLQESEILVFPPFRHLLKRKVHRIHLGTHGKQVHHALLDMFIEDGWDIVFSYEPDSVHVTELGTFTTNDGVLSVVNPSL